MDARKLTLLVLGALLAGAGAAFAALPAVLGEAPCGALATQAADMASLVAAGSWSLLSSGAAQAPMPPAAPA